jgi:hypothetical protein
VRTALVVAVASHALIHIMGFLKWFHLVELPAMTGATLLRLSPAPARAYGVLWLLAFIVLLAAAVAIARRDSWWMLALSGALLSQSLIVIAWSDAKFGSIGNLLILAALALSAGRARFDRRVDAEVRAMLSRESGANASVIQVEDLRHLPQPVRTWLASSGVVGREAVHTVRLKQRGQLRTSAEGSWMPAHAEQYFTVDEPAFVWRVRTKMLGFLPISGRDKYAAGTGHMLIKAASLLSIVDACDEKIAQGAMLRFLGEIVWFPSAALSPYLEWEHVAARRARVTMRHKGVVASAVFTFDEHGRVATMDAERYLGGGAEAKLTPWSVVCTEWRKIRGVQIPTRGDVRWHPPTGEFSYYRWQILDVEYDRAELYREDEVRADEPAEPSTLVTAR